jgi:hypothetical protein
VRGGLLRLRLLRRCMHDRRLLRHQLVELRLRRLRGRANSEGRC